MSGKKDSVRPGSLQRFLTGLSDAFVIDMSEANEVVISAATLPSTPTIRVLAPAVSDGALWYEE